jgi:hypothetical protein
MEIKGENVRKVISPNSRTSITHPDWRRLPFLCQWVPLSHSVILKGGHIGAREPTFTVSTVPPQTLANRSDREGAEAR